MKTCTHVHTNSLFESHICLSYPHTHSRVLGSHVAQHCTAWLYVDEDNIPTHAHCDTNPPHLQDTKSEESSMKDLLTKWGGLPLKLSGGRWLEAKKREGIPGRIPERLKCDFVFREEIKYSTAQQWSVSQRLSPSLRHTLDPADCISIEFDDWWKETNACS